MNKSILNKIMYDLHIQAAGSGFTDLICPKESVEKFIDEMDRLNIKIIGITWWCHVTEGHEPCGMGGPKNKFGSDWYSEIPLVDLVCFGWKDSDVKVYHSCFVNVSSLICLKR